jgi:hypothetical protein
MMFPAWGQVAPLQARRRFPVFEQDIVPLGYYGTTYGAFAPQVYGLSTIENVPNEIEEATRTEVEAVRECEKAREIFEEAKKKFEDCEMKVKDAQSKLQWAKYRSGIYG